MLHEFPKRFAIDGVEIIRAALIGPRNSPLAELHFLHVAEDGLGGTGGAVGETEVRAAEGFERDDLGAFFEVEEEQ